MNHGTLSLLTLLLACTSVCAQNTVRPRPLNVQFPTHGLPLADTSIMQHPTGWVSGHQWGGPEWRKINQALSTNLVNGHWSYFLMNATPASPAEWRDKMALEDLNINRKNYLGWGLGKWAHTSNTFSNEVRRNYFNAWVGMRWEPAENADQSAAWAPRDSLSWPYGFEVRHDSGIVSNVKTDTNYRRFVLDTSRFSGTVPVKVLDSCNPRTSLWRYDTIPGHKNVRGGERLTDSTDGTRMYLTINLRRLDSLDTTVDDAPVLKLVVEGRRFEPDTDGLYPVSHGLPPEGR
ncbi:MAG: hypothetical protein SGJ05_12405 [bacterium]|nr:hypothetical protein [bacterium]